MIWLMSDMLQVEHNLRVMFKVLPGCRRLAVLAFWCHCFTRVLHCCRTAQVVLDERGAAALSRLQASTPTLQLLELCR
jgi:hypothetical protein